MKSLTATMLVMQMSVTGPSLDSRSKVAMASEVQFTLFQALAIAVRFGRRGRLAVINSCSISLQCLK